MVLPDADITLFELAITKLKNELIAYKDENAQLKASILTHSIKINELEFALRDKYEQIDTLLTKSKMREGFNKDLENRLMKSEVKLNELENKNNILISTKEKLMEMIKSMEIEKDDLYKKLSKLELQLLDSHDIKTKIQLNEQVLNDTISNIKISLQKLKQEQDIFCKLEDETDKNALLLELKKQLDQCQKEKTFSQEESCFYKAMCEQMKVHFKDNAVREEAKYHIEKNQVEFNQYMEIISKLEANNKRLQDYIMKNKNKLV